jgi:hypothetical protein
MSLLYLLNYFPVSLQLVFNVIVSLMLFIQFNCFLIRYGDMLNPWGDLIAMARSWCLVKPGGYGIVGVPTGPGDYNYVEIFYGS